jgi:hypothetical protein
VGAAMVIGASTVFVMSAPAYAALGYVLDLKEGDDAASINTSNFAATVCDEERDGNGVHGNFVTTSGAVTTITDPTGSGIGCGHATVASTTYRFRVCEDGIVTSCSSYGQWSSSKAAVFYGANWASYIKTSNQFEVCDKVADGVGVHGTFIGSGGTVTVSDPDGSAGGCGLVSGWVPDRFQVCQGTLCSSWIYIE